MELLHSTRSHSWQGTQHYQVTVQQSTQGSEGKHSGSSALNFVVCVLPYTRSSGAACTEPNSLLYQDRWSFCYGLSQLSPDGGFYCWSISPHHSPPQSSTWTPSCSMSSSCPDYKHDIGKTSLSCADFETLQHAQFLRRDAQKCEKRHVAVVDVNNSTSQKQHAYAVCVSKASQASSNESGRICFEQICLSIQELTTTMAWVIPPFVQHWNFVRNIRAVFMVKVLGRLFGTAVCILVKL